MKKIGLIALLLATGLPVLAQSADLEKQVLDIIKKHPEALVESLKAYQQDQGRAQRVQEWKESIANPVKVDISQAPAQGPTDAPLTLVEFSDFQCPYCVRVQPTLTTLLDKYKGQIRFVYLHLPLPMHPQAKPAALAAWAAQQQGKFFEFHDRLFALNQKLTPTSYEAIAKDLKLDLVKFNEDRQSPQATAQVTAARREKPVMDTPICAPAATGVRACRRQGQGRLAWIQVCRSKRPSIGRQSARARRRQDDFPHSSSTGLLRL